MTQQRFLEMLQSHPGILGSKQPFSGMLMDYFPQTPIIVRLMISLYEMGIHSEIENVLRVTNDFAYRFVKRLVDEHGTDRQRAENAVAIFCVCYGRDILKKPCDLEINPIVESSGLNVCVWDISVPNVAGMTKSEAISMINSAGLSVDSVTSEYHPTVPSGKVIASSLAYDGGGYTTVALRLSKGSKMVIVPDVRHMTKDEAEKEICSAGLSVDSVTSEYHFYEQSGNVIDSIPASGSPVKQGTTVALRLSKGPEMVTVPKVPDDPVTPPSAAPSGNVKGPEMVTVPDLRGMTKNAAETEIRSAGLSDDSEAMLVAILSFGFPLLGIMGMMALIITFDSIVGHKFIYAVTIMHAIVGFYLGAVWCIIKRGKLFVITLAIAYIFLVAFVFYPLGAPYDWMVAFFGVLGLILTFLGGVSPAVCFFMGKKVGISRCSLIFGMCLLIGIILLFFNPSGANYRGLRYYHKGDYDNAIVEYNKALKKPEEAHYSYYNNRGDAYYEKWDYDSAIADYDQAIALNPKFADAYNNRGSAYESKGDYDSAIADYTQAIALKPENGTYYHNRGLAYSSKSDLDSAIADYTQAIALNPEFAYAYNNRGNVYYSKRDYDSAIADYTQAIALKPEFAIAYDNRGNVYYSKRDYDSAIADYSQAIDINPDDAIIYSNRADAYASKGGFDSAIADLTEAIKLDPNNNSFKKQYDKIKQQAQYANDYYNRGDAYYSKRDYDSSINNYSQAIKIKPNFADAYNNRGVSYFYKGDYDSAIADFSQAIKFKPDDANHYNNRSIAYHSRGDLDSAIADLTQVIKLNPNDNGFKERLARLKQQAQQSPPPQKVSIPIVANIAEAEKKIPAAGLTLIVNNVNHNSIPKGNVIDSSPAFGSFVPRGTKVTLRVSSGPALPAVPNGELHSEDGGRSVVPNVVLISVPNVAGMTEEGARAAINSAGLKEDVKYEVHSSVKNGYVIGSIPAHGNLVKPGDTVTLRIVASVWPPWSDPNKRKKKVK